jgi:hypothetical protein
VSLSVALVHHPVYDKHKKVVTTALTNLDLHDIARSSRTYGVETFFIVHPVAAQRELASRILGHWNEQNDFRKMALDLVAVVPSLAAAKESLAARHAQPPLVAGTAARQTALEKVGFGALAAAAATRPVLMVLGTGWGLTDEVLASMDLCLPPLKGPSDYNHLSVRSACAILLDRMYRDRED